MTCSDVTELLDAFVDAELPAAMLLAVARHAGACATCDAAVRELSALHEAVEQVALTDAETLDLSGVWPAVAQRIGETVSRRAWRERLRGAPAWGMAIAAMAAGAVLYVRPPSSEPPTRVATRPRPNQAVIERINSDGSRFELRRERKYGTTLIMVSDSVEAGQ